MRKKLKEASKGLRVLWKYLAVYRSEMTLLSVLGVFSAFANGSVPYVTGKFLDAIIKSHTVFGGSGFAMPAWVLFLTVWGTAQVIAIGTDWVNDRMSRRISAKLFIDYWVGAQTVLLSLPVSFHKNAKPGEIFSAFNKAANSLESISGNIVIYLAPQFLSIAIGVGFAFFMNTVLALTLLELMVI